MSFYSVKTSPAIRVIDLLKGSAAAVPPFPSYPTVTPIAVVKAASVAHRNLGARARAAMAADWLGGKLMLSPTLALVCSTFKVSHPLVSEAQSEAQSESHQKASLPLGMLAYGWRECSASERIAFVTRFEDELWDTLEVLMGNRS